MKFKLLILLVIFLSQSACPMTCIVNPSKADLLIANDHVAGRGITVNGVLMDYNEDYEPEGVLGNMEMPCTYRYYQQNYRDYLEMGLERYDCSTTSGSSGLFSTDILIPARGLYHVEFEQPIFQSRPRVITRTVNIAKRPDNYVYIDWESDPRVEEQITVAFRESLDPPPPDRMIPLLVEFSKTEVERVVKREYFAPFRVSFIDEDGEYVTKVRLVCDGELLDEFGFCGTGGGECALDFANSDPREECEITFNGFSLVNSPTTDNIWVRIADVGYASSKTIAHELGHALGLVSAWHLYGAYYESLPTLTHHNPFHPSFLAALRSFPDEVMMGGGGGHEDCDPGLRREGPVDFVERCPPRWNSLNYQYLEAIQGLPGPGIGWEEWWNEHR